MFGHLAFASHRCWTVYLKKAVFLACEAWRRTYGQGILHSAKKAGNGELLLHLRPNRDPYPLEGWKKIAESGLEFYEGPDGQRCQTLSEAYDIMMAAKSASGRFSDARLALSIMGRLLLDAASTNQNAVVS